MSHPDWSWRDHAACIGHPTEIFFSSKPKLIARAQLVCAKCPVSAECLNDALRANDSGIRGGVVIAAPRSAPPEFERQCRGCSARFLASVRSHYCSDDCRNEARRASWTAAKQKARAS